MRIRLCRLLGLMPLLALMGGAPPSPWSVAALQDLAAMHDLIRDNHPGPVDPANSGFKAWLDGGEAGLLAQARAASSLHDYQLVLRDYANGFADGHLGVTMTDAEAQLWPGFLVRAETRNGPLVASAIGEGADAPAGVRLGAVIESCGGIPAVRLLEERVLRPRLNPHVPQRLPLASAILMVADQDAPADRWASCNMSSGGASRPVALRWRPIAQAVLDFERMRSGGIEIPPTKLRRTGDTWLISIPSFEPEGSDATARLQTLVAEVAARAADLHAARHVVIDLRGNDGGDDAWGIEVAEALWGKAAVEAVEASLPSVVDWRVSARNVVAIRGDAATMQAQGHNEDAAAFGAFADRMERVLAKHEIFIREAGAAAAPVPHLSSPFAHPVQVLTTPHCASACLDFVDLLDGLPGVVRVGLETSADTNYLDVATARLPSGHATLHYAMKVYRERRRGANVSYKPAIAWPGGMMDDASIVRWVETQR